MNLKSVTSHSDELAKPVNNCRLTLRDYQKGCGTPFNEQIILINNPRIFDGYTPYRIPFKKNRIAAAASGVCRFGRSLISSAEFGKLRSDKIFIGYFDRSFDRLDILREVFAQIECLPEIQFEILIGKGDYCVEKQLSENIPENVDRIYANNLNARDSRLQYLPMGRDFRSVDVFKNRHPCEDKKTLCYCNFSTSTHPVRKQLLGMIESKSFIVKQHLGEFLNYSITREEFFDALESSKFCICPRGNAYDTFRMWDALYSGTVPIVVREAVFHELLEDLPILFLDSYDDFENLDAEALESAYSRMLDTEFNFEKLRASCWLN